MPAPATNAELFEVILKSGVTEDSRLKSYLKKLTENQGGLPPEPSKLAGLMVRDGILTYFQAEQLLQGKWKRFFIGKYKVLERLGVGGMGQVFLCEHKLMKRRVAVKVLPVAKAQDEAALSRFYREARAVAAVDHPNIVRAYDIDQDENLHFIVMEFVDGANLHDLVKKHGPMEILRACHYIYGATVGLHHAHEMGLVHRDIKPANILVDRSGVVKILDMGLARFFNPEEDDMLTKKFDENVLGTADYLAPEQAIDSSTVDIRADLYGLGGTFHYILTGLPPFPEGTVAQKLLWHQTKPPKPIRTIRPEVPEGLEAIIGRMLAKSVDDRFQTPAELMAALAPWVQTPIPPPPEHEMPTLSAAASAGFATKTGTGSGAPLATGSSIYGTPMPNPSSATQPLLKSKVLAASASPTLPQTSTPAAVAEGPAVWESLTTDTISNNLTDTADAKKKPKVAVKAPDLRTATVEAEAKPKPPVTRKKSSLLPWIVAGCVGLVLVVGLAAGTIYYVTKKEKDGAEDLPPPTTPRAVKRWYVAASGYGPEQSTTRKTVQDAFKDARNGDTIVILDDRIDIPHLQLGYSNPKQKMTIHIEAGNATKNVTWTFKPAVGGRAPVAVDLINLEESTIDGITLDIGDAEVGIRIQGLCSGTQLRNVHVRGVKKTGVLLNGLDASDAKPLKITKLRTTPVAPDKPYEQAFAILGSATSNVEVGDCRFEGGGKGSGLRIEAAATGLEFNNNRIFNWDNAVLIPGKDDKVKPLAVKFSNNTFWLAKAGIHAEASVAGNGRTLAFDRNLFVKCAEIFKGFNPSPGVKAEQNGMSDSKEGSLSLKAEAASGVNNSAAKPDLGNDFLRGTNGSRPTIGKDKIPVGFE
jgi:serine/threonine protein kinase